MPKIYSTLNIPETAITTLKKKGFEVDVNRSDRQLTEEELKKVFGLWDGIVTSVRNKIDESVISKASPNFKVISNFAVGYDNIDVLAAKRKGILVCNTPGVAGEAVAEHVFALILSVLKSIIESDKYMRVGKFEGWDPDIFVSPQLWGKTLGIVGLGRIGTFVGHIASGGFKMKILYHDLVRSEDFEMITGAKMSSLEKILKESDVVSLHVPLLSSTHHMISKKELAMMKGGAILINTARGPVVDEEALIEVLKQKKIAGAGLDVYEHEPHIPHALTTLGNVVLTPHSGSATVECRDEMARITAENILSVFEGKEPFGLVRVS